MKLKIKKTKKKKTIAQHPPLFVFCNADIVLKKKDRQKTILAISDGNFKNKNCFIF
jgi:hypothetical protein